MDQTIYRLGAELLAVRKFVEKHPEAAALYTALQQMTSAVDISGLPSAPTSSTRPNDRFVAEIALGLICRGWPTMSSPFVEKTLLSRIEAESDLRFDPGPAHEVMWKLTADPAHSDAWAEVFAKTLLPSDSRLRPWRSQLLPLADSDTETFFYFDVLPKVFGPLHACIEWQRPLESMVEDPKEHEKVINRRSDFTIELPAIGEELAAVRVNLEVDGPAHTTGKNPAIDQTRDSVLRRAGWCLERIKVQDVTSGWTLPDGVRNQLMRHPVVHAASIASASPPPKAPDPIDDLLLAPHAIARIQLAVLLALRDGQLSLGPGEWRLLVREREVSAAWLALADLRAVLEHLCDLYDLPAPPDVALTIVEDHRLRREMPENLRTSDLGSTLLVKYRSCQEVAVTDFCLAVDVSVLCRPTQHYGDEQINDRWVRLRTALRRARAETLTWANPREISDPLTKETVLIYFLQYAFRKKEFRDGQLPIIERALQRKSAIGLLPTGAGKSLTYQLPALLTPGITFVVDPIKSLMQDQVDNLEGVGITSALTINSDQSAPEKAANERRFGAGAVRFVFISPERLQIPGFRDTLHDFCRRHPVAFAVVDEAHCVSEWGHDFRTAYLNLGRHVREFLLFEGNPPPIVALTGTASRLVLTDVQREIGVDDPDAVIEPETFDRKELHYEILRVASSEKQEAVLDALSSLPSFLRQESFPFKDGDLATGKMGGIIFCPHVNGKYGVYSVYQHLSANEDWAGQVGFYSGGEPNDFPGDSNDWIRHKAETQRRFKRDELSLLAATSAFGMGIDKPNIRYTIHLGAPKSIEAMAQEMGRAGRDRNPAKCLMVFSDHIPTNKEDPLQHGIAVEQAKERMNNIPGEFRDDACRMMYLHTTGYHGAERESLDVFLYFQEYVRSYWDSIRNVSDHSGLNTIESEVKAFLKGEAEERLHDAELAGMSVRKQPGGPIEDPVYNPGIATDFDRVVYRLTVLGVVTDYTVNYGVDGYARHNLTTVPVSEETIWHNLEKYVSRYRSPDTIPLIRQTFDEAVGDHIERAIKVLCKFVYEEIESQRRESMWNVRQLLRDAEDGEHLRRLLGQHFDRSTFGPLISSLQRRSTDAQDWKAVTQVVGNDRDAGQLLGQARRALESDPEHAGLRLLSGLALAASDMPNPAVTAESLLLGFRSELRLHPERIGEVVDVALEELRRLAPDQFEPVIAEAVSSRKWEAIDAPEAVEELAITALPSVSQSSTRQECAQTIARRLERECAADVRRSSSTVRRMLQTWHERAPGQIDHEVRDVLQALRQDATLRQPSHRALAQFATSSYRLVQDDSLKRACATPILQTLHRAVQHVL